MRVWAITDRGAVRQQNQDSYSIYTPADNCGLAIVCDGMGGAKAGNVASQLAVESFLKTLRQTEPQDWSADPETLLRRCLATANEAVFRRAITDPECEGMGTTVVAAMLIDSTAYILNLGDSRAYYIGETEGIRQITRDHSLVEDLVSRGELSPEAAKNHPQKNLITKALGVIPEIKCDLYEVTLKSGDSILLCSDGLSNVMDDQEISYEVLYGGPLNACCDRLLQLSMSRGAPDNVTVVLLQK